ncbi:MAG: YfhO family protein [Caldilineaceae bacterium SB0670_bin_27]|uniref:YfhO family protein n=1 Tax=Caldilineaceae bacterium SB0664_bin_27 TaxID=2605260 RepID=A0A6B0YU83_9CHLR|nr:YfhO family protein [Caldilineaceae bacterium SB0664_bin_27]MYJ77621.1 YfhO family protein [Caldilineaceae bacterium SB0670_bin_27]
MNAPSDFLPLSIGLLILLLWAGAIAWLTYRRDERRWDLLSAALLAGMFTAFFGRTISGAVYQPADGGDLVSFLFPIYRFAARTLSQGQLPLWNPHLYGGAPFVTDIQAGFLYPPNLLLFLLNPAFDYRWMQLLSIGHLWWAGLGVYALVRTLGHSRPAALLAGLAFGLCDMLFIHLGNLNLIAVLSWSGWILTACHLALTRRSLPWAAVAALLFSIANYAGHAQSSYYLGMTVGIYSLGLLAADYWENLATGAHRTALRQALAGLQYPLTVFILAALLSAPILLPAFEMLPYTQRGAFDYQDTVSYSLAPGPAFIGLLTPGFFGRGPAAYWGSWDRVELPYAGLVTLLLAAAACLLSIPERRRRLLPWLALALSGFAIALGGNTPIHGWLTRILPVYGSFQAPARTIVLWALALSVLAAIGLDALLKPRDKDRGSPLLPHINLYFSVISISGPTFLLVLITLLLVTTRLLNGDPVALQRAATAGQALLLASFVWIAARILLAEYRRQRLASGTVAALLLALLLLELFAAGANIDASGNDPTSKFLHPEIVAFLREQAGEEPDCAPTGAECRSAASGTPSRYYRIDTRTGILDLWQPNAAALAGLQDVWGVSNPLELVHWHTLWENNGGRHTRIYDMYNVRFVIVRDGTPLDDQYTLAYDAPGPLAVYENPDPLPRAWLVPEAQLLPDEEDVLAALKQPAFEPLHTVVLAQNHDNTSIPAPADESLPLSMAEPVSVSAYSPNEILLAAHAERPGYLVLSEVWFPGWLATVNGEPAPVLRANYTFRALPVPDGDLEVRLWYAPKSWRRGLALLGVGFLLLAGLYLSRLITPKMRGVQRGV